MQNSRLLKQELMWQKSSISDNEINDMSPKTDTWVTVSETGLVPLPLPVMYQVVESGSTGKLGPFALLAVDMSRLDRDLLHFCEDISL